MSPNVTGIGTYIGRFVVNDWYSLYFVAFLGTAIVIS